VRVHVLASGSKGNAILVEDGDHRLLVDAGLSARELERRLRLVGCWPPALLQGILITHEHSDHVRGLRLLATRHGIPVFATRGTFEGMDEEDGRELRPLWTGVDHGRPFAVPGCGMQVLPVHIPHDTNHPVGYVVTSSCGRYRAGIATDLGHEERMVEALTECNLLVLEFNHDERLLRGNRKYPESLKKRILGDEGHLSNAQAADLLGKLLHPYRGQRLESLVLAHLSEQNNTPELALAAARGILSRFRLEGRVELRVAGPAEPVTVQVRG
jgi:phosphoribosyl 1,2-cyclic phosphodiesterase